MAGLAALTQRFFGSANERRIKAIRPTVEKINALEGELERLSDDALKARTQEFRDQIAKGAKVDTLLVPAFATVREAAKRTLGQRHFDVQLIGGAVLHAGDIAEMRTGEGKTLVATLPVYLNALAGKGVHVVTVNDYLARRDSSWMGVVYEFLGLSVGVILNDMNDEARRAAYNCDITYGTNNEFGFDFLRDNMKHERAAMTQQRGHSYAIVDEVDSVLIDEARTPLIISGPLEDRSQFYHDVDGIIPQLGEDDYELDEKARTAVFTEPGNEHVETLLANDGMLKGESLYDIENVAIVHHLQQALKAHKLFRRDRDYIVRQDQVVIIDEFTGRMMAGRRYSEGLHQALEAKEKVTIQPESQTLASITFQNYFRMYDKLAGMTGTALTEAEEFADIYKLDVIEVPTNLPVARKDNDDEIYRTIGEKHTAIVELIDGCQQRGQPVLVGTTSIEKSEILASLLKKNGFRQADLDDSAALEKALSAEGGSDKNGNADSKIKGNRRRKLFAVLNARYHEQEASIIALAGLPGAVTIATNMAGRGTDIQLGGNLDMRLQRELGELEEDDPQREEIAKRIEDEILSLRKRVIEAGGLYVMGTERHESRRIDNQLRGRSGRQGDPGQSKFFLSLEDDLMRIFGSDRMDGMLRRLGLEEGEPIIHRWINKALEKAQQKVEARNFDIRKNLLKFDNVMNDQRMVVFEQRLELMDGEGIAATITDMRHDVIADVVATHVPERAYPEQWESEALYRELAETMALDIPVVEWAQEEGIDQEALRQRIEKAADAAAAQRAAQIGASSFRKLERTILLQMLDHLWREHLSNLDHLRSVVGFRGYGQRDPLQEYRTEAFSLFEKMLGDLRTNVTRQLMRIEFVSASAEMQEEGKETTAPKDDIGNVKVRLANINGPAGHSGDRMEEKETGDSDARRKIGRNAPCPCGSGKKYKHCHGRL